MPFREITNETKSEDYPETWDPTGEKKGVPGAAETVATFIEQRTVKQKDMSGKDVEKKVYEVEIEGTPYSIWGTGHLDYLIKKANPQRGDTLKIKFEGRERVENIPAPVKRFRLWVDEQTREGAQTLKPEPTTTEEEDDYSDMPF